MTFRASSYDALDEGIYDAVLDDIETGDNEFGDYRRWKFTIATPDGPREFSAMTSGASGPKSKAYGWAATLLGHRPTGEEEELRGRRCQLHLIVNDDGFNRVGALLPAAKTQGGSSINLNRLDDQVYAKQAEVPF